VEIPDAAILLTIDQVAEMIGFSTQTVRTLSKRGELPCVRVCGRSLRWRRADVLRFIEQLAAPSE
jgi:excisionase family DNA binding protein